MAALADMILLFIRGFTNIDLHTVISTKDNKHDTGSSPTRWIQI
jgi:hypothetical protein